LQKSEFEHQQNLQRLSSVGEFRLEYMKRLNQRSIEGVDSTTYTHFHSFVAKLDHAADQVKIAIRQSKALVEQNKKLWIEQQRKVQAVEILKEKLTLKLQLKANKQEQNMFDEIGTQQFIRKQFT